MKTRADVEQGGSPSSKVDPLVPDVKPANVENSPAPEQACNPRLATITLLFKYPHLLVAPVVLFCLIVALCSFGIVHATNASYNLEGEQARDAAASAAEGIAMQLSSASRAALSLAAFVKMNPKWSFLEDNFLVLAKELFRQSNDEGNLVLRELAFIPFGRVRVNYGVPVTRNSTADMFSPELVDRLGPYRSIRERGLTVNGPIPLTNTDNRAFAARYPVFFTDTDEDESWGHPDNITHPTGCPGPPCYNPETGEKWWGFIGALVNAEPLLAGDNVHLKRLLSDDLSYSLTTSFLAGTNGPGILVSGGPNPNKVTANVSVNLPGTSWALSVHNPRQEQVLKLRDGLLAMVVVAAFILSVLLLLLLLSAKRASVYLQEQLVTNRLLQEEKVSREALLGRQFDLIACFEQTSKRSKSRSRSMLDGQLSTLERIASARAAIADMAPREDEDINVQELLAEGSFGKVYRGKWRGADVAVKIIMLPANMSGREKREKMVVWEAAISSSLIHPNICQTYHYRIKPVKESSRSGVKSEDLGSAVIFSDVSSSRQKSGILTESKGHSDSSCPEEVHSYEVQLVLEYCDRSSLRDALDAGLFMTPTGLNYAAQLDCAMDVAKAMLHLHCNNVLHLDLKTRNVLLSSSCAEGKGVICKVSDFGLSVRMDHSETHVSSLFQGTMTHMAPEVLLKGTCSKASDVYAFGIVLWELFTCGSPFRCVPAALLGHSIVKDGKRPEWPSVVPQSYRDLANACWDQNPDARPSFEVILEELLKMRKALGIPTPPLPAAPVRRPPRKQPQAQEHQGSPFSAPQVQSQASEAIPNHPGSSFSAPQVQSQTSTASPATKGPSTPSQDHSCAGHDVLGRSASEGSASEAPREEDEAVSLSADFVQDKSRQGERVHPQPGSWETGNECSKSASDVLGYSTRGLLTTSAISGRQAQHSPDPKALSAPPIRAPRPLNSRASSDGASSSSFSGGAFRASHPPPRRPRPSRMRRSVKKGATGEPLLIIGAEGGPERQMSHHKSSLLQSFHLPPIGEDDAQHQTPLSANSR